MQQEDKNGEEMICKPQCSSAMAQSTVLSRVPGNLSSSLAWHKSSPVIPVRSGWEAKASIQTID
jgi:hypothetical protein